VLAFEITAIEDEVYAPPSTITRARTFTRSPPRVAPVRIQIRDGCRCTWPTNDSARP
jgi:hypothetical protein